MAESPQAVVVGCSAGGVHALGVLLSGISPQLPVPVVIVCHTGSEDVEMLCDVLALKSSLPVQEAAERQAPAAGRVYIAPAGYHLLLEAHGHFALSVDARVCYSRPSIDVLFEAAARYYRQRLVGVVLTGANDDGAVGLKAIREQGGFALVQEPGTCVASAMPEAALRIAGADAVLPLTELAPFLNRLCSP